MGLLSLIGSKQSDVIGTGRALITGLSGDPDEIAESGTASIDSADERTFVIARAFWQVVPCVLRNVGTLLAAAIPEHADPLASLQKVAALWATTIESYPVSLIAFVAEGPVAEGHATGAKSWIYRFTLDGRAHEMGLGPIHSVSLSLARTRAAEYRLMRRDGIDPPAVYPFTSSHLKRILRLDRLRPRGPCGARDAFLLAATAQDLRKLGKLILLPRPKWRCERDEPHGRAAARPGSRHHHKSRTDFVNRIGQQHKSRDVIVTSDHARIAATPRRCPRFKWPSAGLRHVTCSDLASAHPGRMIESAPIGRGMANQACAASASPITIWRQA
jgi:Arm DNA-binding domain